MFDLSGKSAIVTGAAQGIGRGIAIVLAKCGADVVVTDILFDGAKAVAKEIESLGRKSLAMKVDVTKRDEVHNMVQEAVKKFGKLDILVANAGVGSRAMIHEMTEQQWDAVLNVNFKGVFFCDQAAAIVMRKQNHGRIINISSRAAKGGSLGHCSYAASKAGVIGLTKSVAQELGPFKVCVNAVLPGFVLTPLTDRLTDAQKKDYRDKIIIKDKVGVPEDIGYAVAFLASDEALYVTGTTLEVTGGTGMFAG